MADLWQGGRILAGLLATVTWADAPSAVVLTGGAVVSEDESGDLLSDPPAGMTPDGPPDLTPPFARVSRVSFTTDRESPGRFEEVVYRVYVTAGSAGITNTAGTAGDTHGIDREKGLLRAATTPQGKSDGKTADEVVCRLLESIGPAGGTGGQFVDSIHALQGYAIRGDTKDAEDASEILTAHFDVIVYNGTISRFYHPPYRFKGTASGGGAVALTWVNAPTRYDTYQNVLRRGTNGGVAPTAPSGAGSGTGVSITGGVLGTSATDSGLTPAGIYKYSLFHVYSEVLTGDRYSVALNSTVTVT